MTTKQQNVGHVFIVNIGPFKKNTEHWKKLAQKKYNYKNETLSF